MLTVRRLCRDQTHSAATKPKLVTQVDNKQSIPSAAPTRALLLPCDVISLAQTPCFDSSENNVLKKKHFWITEQQSPKQKKALKSLKSKFQASNGGYNGCTVCGRSYVQVHSGRTYISMTFSSVSPGEGVIVGHDNLITILNPPFLGLYALYTV